MNYQERFSADLLEIINLINDKKLFGENEALDKFKLYVIDIQQIGNFSIEGWPTSWRINVWKFGALFTSQDPILFTAVINSQLENNGAICREVLEFILSEIVYNFLPDADGKLKLQELIKNYPLNSEFRHTLGHYFSKEEKYIDTLEQYKLARKIDPQNIDYRRSLFSADQSYLNSLILDGKLDDAKTYLDQLFNDVEYIKSDLNVRNAFVDFNLRIDDHRCFQKQLKKTEEEFRLRMREELDNERKKVIELLGFFSAIVAFILSTVTIGKNFSYNESLSFIVALGSILLLFLLSISLLFSTGKKPILRDFKFWLIISSLLIMILYVLENVNICKLFQK